MSQSAKPLLAAYDLRVRYGAIEALHGVTVAVDHSEIVAIIGANGAGKTTLMNTLIGVHRSTTGAIEFDGSDITRASTKRRIGAGLSLAPEGRQIFPTLSVENNLNLGAFARGRDVYARRNELMAFIYDMFGALKERRKQAGGSLSGGEQQMLAIGRAMMAEPSLLLVDEMSQGLAPRVVAELYEQLGEFQRERGTAICIVEQEVAMALRVAERAYVMASGEIVLSGRANELREDARVEKLYLVGEVDAS